MFTTTGRVVGHVGAFAVLQMDGGLLPIRDEARALTPGTGALVEVVELDSAAYCAALEACAAFHVTRDGPLVLLSPPDGDQPVALVSSLAWPRRALVRVSTPSPELDEGTEAEPFGPRIEPTPRIRNR